MWEKLTGFLGSLQDLPGNVRIAMSLIKWLFLFAIIVAVVSLWVLGPDLSGEVPKVGDEPLLHVVMQDLIELVENVVLVIVGIAGGIGGTVLASKGGDPASSG